MNKLMNADDTYERPVQVAEGVFWIGFHDVQAGLHCNPYLIIDKEEAVVIDGGSRPDFATVMLKILQTGIMPQQIKALIYQHYDPDLCGSIPNFEDTIGREDLKILSASENMMFIRHYSVSSRLVPLSKLNFQFEFASGRRLEFIKTPYAHAPGSFVTFDPQTRVLFTSDIFGSYGQNWQLYLQLPSECIQCQRDSECIRSLPDCPVDGILHFHKKIMTSTKALRYALNEIAAIPFDILAPQHGSIIKDQPTIKHVFELLLSLERVGIDRIVQEDQHA